MLRPPALKAICSIFASDDRYADDVHYFGGAKKQLDDVVVGVQLVARCS
jgi:predicted acyl esterase